MSDNIARTSNQLDDLVELLSRENALLHGALRTVVDKDGTPASIDYARSVLKRLADVASVSHSRQTSPPATEMADAAPRSSHEGCLTNSPAEGCAVNGEAVRMKRPTV